VSTQTPAPPIPPPPAKPSGFLRWQRRILGFCLVIFAFEIGMFLIVFPWLRTWDLNWAPLHSQRFSDIWMSRYLRGALSGLGLLNIYVAFAELIRQLKAMFGEEAK
jgi:hypothetical protein